MASRHRFGSWRGLRVGAMSPRGGLVALLVSAVLALFAVTALLLDPFGLFRGPRSDEETASGRRLPTTIQEYARKFPKELGRLIYPFSVVPGGTADKEEAMRATLSDPLVREHYRNLKLDKLTPVTLAEDRYAYVSFRKGDKIFWTSKKIRLFKGETLLTDGTNFVRARCGNLVSDAPMAMASLQEPPEDVLNSPILPTGPLALLQTPEGMGPLASPDEAPPLPDSAPSTPSSPSDTPGTPPSTPYTPTPFGPPGTPSTPTGGSPFPTPPPVLTPPSGTPGTPTPPGGSTPPSTTPPSTSSTPPSPTTPPGVTPPGGTPPPGVTPPGSTTPPSVTPPSGTITPPSGSPPTIAPPPTTPGGGPPTPPFTPPPSPEPVSPEGPTPTGGPSPPTPEPPTGFGPPPREPMPELPEAVPEPTTLLLSGGGMVFMAGSFAWIRRRRKMARDPKQSARLLRG